MSFVDFEYCYITVMLVGVGLYVQTAVWCGFVITSIVIVELSIFIMQHQLTNFVMLASIVIVKSTPCVQ